MIIIMIAIEIIILIIKSNKSTEQKWRNDNRQSHPQSKRRIWHYNASMSSSCNQILFENTWIKISKMPIRETVLVLIQQSGWKSIFNTTNCSARMNVWFCNYVPLIVMWIVMISINGGSMCIWMGQTLGKRKTGKASWISRIKNLSSTPDH